MNVPPRQVFCDTSFFYACLDEHDSHYDEAGRLLTFCQKHRVQFVTTWDIILETVTLLRYRVGYRPALEFLDAVLPTITLVEYDIHVRNEAVNVFRRLSRDKELSLCDALSYVIVTQILDNIPSLTFDSDFKDLGLSILNLPPATP